MITPNQAAITLKVSTSTLRRWSSDFEPFLSPRKGVKRLYTIEDIATLKRIQGLYKQGMNTAQVQAALPLVEGSPVDKALITLPEFAAALSQARAEQAKLVEDVNTLTRQVNALQDYFALPWYKRIFKKPGNSEKGAHENS
jgi:DNA-binding transcriptional MerR regulator